MTIAKNNNTKKTKPTQAELLLSLRTTAVSASVRAVAHQCNLSTDDAEVQIRNAIDVSLREWAGVITRGYTREQAKAALAMLRDAGARGWGMHSLFPGDAERLIWEMANSN